MFYSADLPYIVLILSLDEPDMEVVIFTSDRGDGKSHDDHDDLVEVEST